MDWIQVLTIIASTIGCCWFFRKETKEQISEMNAEMKDFHQAMKDFHGRLCRLEEKYQQMMQRYLEEKK